MRPSASFSRFLLCILLLAVSTAALSHPRLLLTSPADDGTSRASDPVTLTFSEPLLVISGADLILDSMPGMKMPPQHVAVTTKQSDDAKTIVLTPVKPLVAGSYRVEWHVTSVDTHGATGSLHFSVH